MRQIGKTVGQAVLGMSLLLAATPGQANDVASADVAFLVGGALDTQGGGDNPTPYGVGIGARAGVIWESLNLYSGFIGTYLPASEGTYRDFAVDADHYQLGGELGYELRLFRRLAVRPSVGGGAVLTSMVGAQDAELEAGPFVAPALSLSVIFGDVRVGMDGRYWAAFNDDQASSIAVYGTLGLRLGGDTRLAAKPQPQPKPRRTKTAKLPATTRL